MIHTTISAVDNPDGSISIITHSTYSTPELANDFWTLKYEAHKDCKGVAFLQESERLRKHIFRLVK